MKTWIDDFPINIIPKLERFNIDGKRHYKLDDDNIFPSITSILSCRGKISLDKWKENVGEELSKKIGRNAANRGTRYHKICENYLSNLDPFQTDNEVKLFLPSDKEMFYNTKSILDRIDNIVFLERYLFSKKIKIAGTVDCIAEFDGELSIIDFKTSSKMKYIEDIPNYFAQATAYSLMFRELFNFTIEDIVIIIGIEETGESIVYKSNVINHMEYLKKSIQMFNNGEYD